MYCLLNRSLLLFHYTSRDCEAVQLHLVSDDDLHCIAARGAGGGGGMNFSVVHLISPGLHRGDKYTRVVCSESK